MNERQHDAGMGNLASGVLGMIIGAAGAFTALVLSDPENQRKVKGKMNDLRTKGTLALDEVRSRATRAADELQGKEETVLDKAESYSHEIGNKAKKTAHTLKEKINRE